MNSAKRDSPWETLQLLLAKGPQGTIELFREYCIESFFIWDHRGVMFMPEIYSRYGQRRIIERFELSAGTLIDRGLTVPHLACHYHQVNFNENVAAVMIQLSSGWAEMMFDVIPVTLAGERGALASLAEGVTQSLPTTGVRYFAIVISNCSSKHGSRDYEITLSAS